MSQVTIKDIAFRAGVGAATVDRYLNGRGNARPQTAQKIDDAIAELNYQPNLSAVRLARGYDKRIGLVIPNTNIEFLNQLEDKAQSLTGALETMGGRLTIRRADIVDSHKYLFAMKEIGRESDVVLVLSPPPAPDVIEAINYLEASNVKVITIISDVLESRRTLYVGPDNEQIGRTAGELIWRTCARKQTGHFREEKVLILAPNLAFEGHQSRMFGCMDTILKCGAVREQVIVLDYPAGGTLEEIQAVLHDKLCEHVGYVQAVYMTGGHLNTMLPTIIDCLGRAPLIVATDLTITARDYLQNNKLDFVVSTTSGEEIEIALREAMNPRARISGRSTVNSQVYVFTRSNLPSENTIGALIDNSDNMPTGSITPK